MNKITSAIKCVNCQNVLDSPVLLPCSHSICQKHTNKRNSDGELKAVLCHTCAIEHPVPASGEFPKNAQLADIIESRINELDFGKDYNEAKESCVKLDDLFASIDQVLADPRNYTYEAMKIMKDTVQMRGDELKLKIDEKMNELFTLIGSYENDCKHFLATSAYAEKCGELNSRKDLARKDLEAWQTTLDQMKRNEIEWRNIKKMSEIVIERFEAELARFQRGLLLDQKRYDQLFDQIELVYRKLEADPQLNSVLGYNILLFLGSVYRRDRGNYFRFRTTGVEQEIVRERDNKN
jgi:tetratricopeptide (TPR) repeat protein